MGRNGVVVEVETQITEPCYQVACPTTTTTSTEEGEPVDCKGKEEEKGECDCTTKKRAVVYIVELQEQHGGNSCPRSNNKEYTKSCEDECDVSVNCIGKWSEPTPCSVICGEGTQT